MYSRNDLIENFDISVIDYLNNPRKNIDHFHQNFEIKLYKNEEMEHLVKEHNIQNFFMLDLDLERKQIKSLNEIRSYLISINTTNINFVLYPKYEKNTNSILFMCLPVPESA